MSLATQLFAAAIAEQDRQALHQINPAWLTEDELQMHSDMLMHIRQFGQLPSVHTMRTNYNASLPRAEEPVAYYLTQLPIRAVHTHYRDQIPELVNVLERRDVDQAKAIIRDMLAYAATHGSAMEVRTIQQEAGGILEDYEARRGTYGLIGNTTGYDPLDVVTGGLIPGDMYGLIGRPGMGKSYTLFHMAHRHWRAGHVGLVISPEMSVRQCARRIMGMESGVSPTAIRNAQISSYVEDGFRASFGRIDERPPMHFYAWGAKDTIDNLDVLVQELNPDTIYFDSAYLASPSGDKRRASRREYVADAINEIKTILLKRNLPGVISVQFNREVSKKTASKTLDLSMIGEADAIGQALSVAIAITPGDGVHNRTRRKHTLIKNREDEEIVYETQFRFSPLSFAAIPGTEKTREGKHWVRGGVTRDGEDDFNPDAVDVAVDTSNVGDDPAAPANTDTDGHID